MIVLDGPSSNGIGRGIAKALKVKCVNVVHKLFPDGESYVRIPSLHDDTVAVVQSTYTPQEKHILELLFIAETLRDMGIGSIIAVVPYLAYTRQNKSFADYEAVSINTIMKLLNESGIGSLVTVEPHKASALSLFRGETRIVDPSRLFAKAIAKSVKDPFVMATDLGDIERAKHMAGLLKCEYDYIEKERKTSSAVVAKSTIKSDVRGKEVVIVDDVISTGSTMELAARIASSKGAKRIIAAAAHLVMAGNAYGKLRNAGVSELYGTNTIPYENARIVDVSDEMADAVSSIKD